MEFDVILCDAPREELATLFAGGAVVVPACKPIDAEWKERLRDCWWATNFGGDPRSGERLKDGVAEADAHREAVERARLLKLRDEHLLKIGGEEACLPDFEEDIAALLEYGQIWDGRSTKIPGRPSDCHFNSVSAWTSNADRIVVVTGYALSDDGMWRQHSWCMGADRRGRPKVYETTVPREAYFGVPLTYEECVARCDDYFLVAPERPRANRCRP